MIALVNVLFFICMVPLCYIHSRHQCFDAVGYSVHK